MKLKVILEVYYQREYDVSLEEGEKIERILREIKEKENLQYIKKYCKELLVTKLERVVIKKYNKENMQSLNVYSLF